jgi:hypothetical protein
MQPEMHVCLPLMLHRNIRMSCQEGTVHYGTCYQGNTVTDLPVDQYLQGHYPRRHCKTSIASDMTFSHLAFLSDHDPRYST